MSLGHPDFKVRTLVQVQMYAGAGVIRYFCSEVSDPSGCRVQDSGGTVRFWEPRVRLSSLVQDCGNLDGGMQKHQVNSLTLRTNWQGSSAYDDLLNDALTFRIEGATVTIWTETADADTAFSDDVDDYDKRFVGQARVDGAATIDVFGGVLRLMISEIDGPWTLPLTENRLTTDTYSSLPAANEELLLPMIFGNTENAQGIDVVAYCIDNSSSTPGFVIGTTGAASNYDNPIAVRRGGTTITAQSPITDAPGANEWGSWSPSAGTFYIDDTGNNIDDSTIITVKALGIEDASSAAAPTDADEVIESLRVASGWGATFDATVMGRWTTDLSSNLNIKQLLGVFPVGRSSTPVMLGNVLDDAMKRTCSVMRVGLDGRWACVLPGGTDSTLHTLYGGDIQSMRLQINPAGDYATEVVGVWYAFTATFNDIIPIRNSSGADSTEEALLHGQEVIRDEETIWQQNRVQYVTSERFNLRSQAMYVSTTRISLRAGDSIVCGDRVQYQVYDLTTLLPAGHVRKITRSLTGGWAEVIAYHLGYWPS